MFGFKKGGIIPGGKKNVEPLLRGEFYVSKEEKQKLDAKLAREYGAPSAKKSCCGLENFEDCAEQECIIAKEAEEKVTREEMAATKKPPLGVMPREIWIYRRSKDLLAAMNTELQVVCRRVDVNFIERCANELVQDLRMLEEGEK